MKLAACALAVAAAACGGSSAAQPDATAPDGAPLGCDPAAPGGTLHGQILPAGDGSEDRTYWLHVPPGYVCGTPSPLLVDFHGTASDVPEEAYQTDALIAFADAHGVIVARPRSRSSLEGGSQIYRWDQNAGDLPRNVRFADNLVASLERTYDIDRTRVYASGFSSGSNMAAQFLTDAASPFLGLAPIAGGHWGDTALPVLATGLRVYMSTGYRDYLWPTARDLVTDLAAAGLPADHLFVSHTGGGHDLYPWHFDELWQFLDGKSAPDGGTVAAPWVVEPLPAPADVNAFALDGTTLVAAGAQGRTWRRGATGWAGDLDRGPTADFTALCFSHTHAIVGGDYAAAVGTGGTWAPSGGLPDFGMLGAGWANRADCRDDGSFVVVGYWSSLVSTDGVTWTAFHAPTAFGLDAQLAGVASAPGGATIVAGYYDYLARAPYGTAAAVEVAHPAVGEWWNAVAAAAGGHFWVVGDDGGILASADDGQTWVAQASGTTENLYAVHFADAQHGAAVGRRGTVVVTADGGAHWAPRALGKGAYLGAVLVTATDIWIGGAGGLVASSPR